jgi:hypothetical protein
VLSIKWKGVNKMPVKDCMTGSPYCPDVKYEEFHDPVLSEHELFTDKHESKHNGVPKHIFAKHKGEHKNKFTQFAENVQILKNRTHHHM